MDLLKKIAKFLWRYILGGFLVCYIAGLIVIIYTLGYIVIEKIDETILRDPEIGFAGALCGYLVLFTVVITIGIILIKGIRSKWWKKL